MNAPIRVGEVVVLGGNVDMQTRCVHYRSELDIVAIRFHCCGRWYPCLHCHAEHAGHGLLRWPATSFDVEAVLCGVCASALTISSYLATDRCPSCAARFNPGCALHHGEYFELS